MPVKTFKILSGQSLSEAIPMNSMGNGSRLAIVGMPAAWDAANLTFQVSLDNQVSWLNLYDSSGSEYSVTAAASRAIMIPLADFIGVTDMKIRSGTAAAAVNQTANRTLTIVGAR